MPQHATRLLRAVRGAAVIAAVGTLVACASGDLTYSGDKIDYRTKAQKTAPLDIPPDLTQLSRDARYTPQAGSVSATTYQGAPVPGTPAATGATPGAPAAAPAGPQKVAVTDAAGMRVERDGDQRWLVVPFPPEALWPRVRGFWEATGFVIASANAEAGVMETDWAENRAKISNDWIRATLGKVLDPLYSTSERDKFRTRIERTATGSEIYIAHRGMQEVFITQDRSDTAWQPRPSDPSLEADMLGRLMVALGASEQQVRTAVAEAPQRPARARVLKDQPGAALQVDESFERAWRRVGASLDRAGFTVEDRDRAGGIYFVRYVDPKPATKAEPGMLNRMFGTTPTPPPATRLRIAVKGDGDKSVVAVLDDKGAPETSAIGEQIVAVLVQDLK